MPIEWLRAPQDGAGRNEDGDTRTITWTAAGAISVEDALADGNLPVTYNSAYPDAPASGLRCRVLRVTTAGYGLQQLTAEFSKPDDGDTHPEPDDLTKPVVYQWQTVQETLPADRDVNGNAIITSSRRAVEGVTTTRNYKRLTITRWENSYSVQTAQQWENRVNSAVWNGAAAGEVKCVIIQPNQSFTLASTLIGVDYVFDFKDQDIWGEQPWQTYVVNRDSFALAAGAVRRILAPNGEPLSDVLLDANGVPTLTGATYREDEGGLIASSPSWTSQSLPTGATAVTVGAVTFLRYQTCAEANFNSLGL